MKLRKVTFRTLDNIPAGAKFIGEETEVTEKVIGWNFLVPVEPPEPTPPIDIHHFVTVKDGQFNLDDQRIKFAGTNAYYLPTYESHDPAFCDRTWDLFAESGVNLVRSWAFYDGPPKFDGDPSFQAFEDGIPLYNEEGLQCLDRTVAKAGERGIHLILALTNYHADLGGYREYCKAVGVPETFSHFMNSDGAQVLFETYIRMLLNRLNTITGRQYKNEPAILAWEICNEARNPQGSPGFIRDWYRKKAQFIKSIDPNHLVATGEDGFEDAATGEYGTDGKINNDHYTVDDYSNQYVLRANEGTSYLLNTAIPEIDFGSFHWYPTSFGFGKTVTPEMLLAQKAWIEDHATIAGLTNGKPAILGEYGFSVDSMPSLDLYSHLWKASEIVLDGDLLWQFVADGPKLNENGGNIAPGRGPYDEFLVHLETMKQGL